MPTTDCRLYIRVSPSEFKKFKTLQEHGYTTREVFELLGDKICDTTITFLSKKNGEHLKFSKNLLSKKYK